MKDLRGLAVEALKLALGLALIALRYRYFAFDTLGNLALAIALVLQFYGYQRMLAPLQPQGLIQGLECSQWGWFAFALSLAGEGPVMGSLGFLFVQGLLKVPLKAVLGKTGFKHKFLIVLAFLAIVGCLPFASFLAYFYTFIPLMSVGDSVSNMSQKLYSGAGLWAVIVLLSVVYQSCALGYFYWVKVLNSDPEAASQAPGPGSILVLWYLRLGLLASLGLGLFGAFYRPLTQSILLALGIEIH